MRIISGKFKGKKLIQPIDKKTRPLKDMAKESIFNLLVHSKYSNFKFEKKNILDLFSGSGSFGIECLSRNANHVTFIENYKEALDILKENLNNLKKNNNYDLIERDIYDKNTYNHIYKTFDLIFIDPPFKDNDLKDIFLLILKKEILTKKGLVIIHRNVKSKDIFPEDFEVIDTRTYGISKIIVLKPR